MNTPVGDDPNAYSSLFDFPPSRQGSDSVKWGKYAGTDVLPLWVADMDFAAPPHVLAAIQERVAHGVMGYGHTTQQWQESLCHALLRDYGWRVTAESLLPLPGLVVGLNVACRALADEGTSVLTGTPIYPPFMHAPTLSGRTLIKVPMCPEVCAQEGRAESSQGGRWGWDWDALEQTLAQASGSGKPSLLLLCHPHNPIGRVWRREELERLLELVLRYDLLVCSDEIHCDLQLEPGARHFPFAALGREAAERTMTLMAPSKTYNIPGLGAAFAIVENPRLRQRIQGVMRGIVPEMNLLGMAACTAAYADANLPWRTSLLSYLRQNRDMLVTAVQDLQAYGLHTWSPEATYLAWLDVRELCLRREIGQPGQSSSPARYFETYGLGLSEGKDFACPGFVRLNFGCSRSTLVEAIKRLRRAVIGE